jgi:hypothetical protein
MIRIGIITTWIMCWFLSWGILNAHFQWLCRNEWIEICNQYEANEHRSISCLFSIGGPLSLIAVLGTTGFAQHGWSLNTTPAYITKK